MYSISEVKDMVCAAQKIGSETDLLELKDARGGRPQSIWRAISAFSHSPTGGVIVFGVIEEEITRKIQIVGGLNIPNLQESLSSFMRGAMVSPGNYKIETFEFEGKDLIALIIDETPYENKPCYLKSKGLPNGACIREGNVNRRITEEEMKSFIRNNRVFKFDRSEAKETEISSLSMEKIGDFLEKSAEKTNRSFEKGEPTSTILKNIGLADNFEEGIKPTVAGVLIFSKLPPQQLKDFTRYLIRCVRYSGVNAASDIIDKQDLDGTLDEQIDGMHQFILRNISKTAVIKGTKRVENYEYPEEALREIVANAVVHRNYMITETYTQVNIFANRIEISNPGCLPPGVTVENIKDSQFSRNEVIASTLKDLEYLEEYGRGIDIVISRMKEYSLPSPIFKNESNKFTVVLFGPVFKELNDRQIAIWNHLRGVESITSKDCRDLFPEASRATISNDLSKLVKLNLIELKGSSAQTYYILAH